MRYRVPVQEVIAQILEGYRLSPLGIHGVGHWARVLETGRCLAERNGADPAVVEYFAVFHDARRRNDDEDPAHGARGATLAGRFEPELDLSAAQLEQLQHACRHHTGGTTEGSVTVRTCWDADRLDLWRVGIRPIPRYLCTKEALDPELMAWARDRSVTGFVPDLAREWLRLAGLENP